MKSFDNDEIGHLNDGHQRITFKHKGQLCICKKTISHTHNHPPPPPPAPTHTHTIKTKQRANQYLPSGVEHAI